MSLAELPCLPPSYVDRYASPEHEADELFASAVPDTCHPAYRQASIAWNDQAHCSVWPFVSGYRWYCLIQFWQVLHADLPIYFINDIGLAPLELLSVDLDWSSSSSSLICTGRIARIFP
jgi:hypothetical protein